MSNDVAAAEVEECLYLKPGDTRVYAHVKIRNNSKSDIGFDPAGIGTPFFINQLIEANEPFRATVDEPRTIHSPITDAQKEQLLAKFKESIPADGAALENQSGRFVHVPAEKTFYYYVPFNDPNIDVEKLQKSTKKYVVVVMDGHMNITDGTAVKPLIREQTNFVGCDMSVPLPLMADDVPRSALVLEPGKH